MREKIILYSSRFIYISLILIPFVASFSSAFVTILVSFSIFAFLVKKITKKEFLPQKNVINLPFLLLFMVSLFSFVNSVCFRSSMQGVGKLAIYGTLFIILAEELKDIGQLKKIIVALISGLYLVSLDGVYQLWFGLDLLRHHIYDFVIGMPRINATFPHTNIFGSYLTLFLSLPTALTLYYFKGRRKLLLGLISSLAIFCLIFTFSRSAIAGFGTALLFMAIIRKNKLVLLLLIIILIITPFLLPQNIIDWIKSVHSPWIAILGKERPTIYKTAFNMIKQHPFLGVGLNTFCLNFQQYRVKEAVDYIGSGQYYAHNIYLHLAAETGIISLIIFFWLLFAFLKSWFKFYKSADNNFLKVCSLGIIAGIIAFLINGLTETNLYYPKVAILFWYQIGLFLGILKINKENG